MAAGPLPPGVEVVPLVHGLGALAAVGLYSKYSSALILLAFMLLAGILTKVVPAGSFARYEEAGRVLIDPESYQMVDQPDYPVWRWLTAGKTWPLASNKPRRVCSEILVRPAPVAVISMGEPVAAMQIPVTLRAGQRKTLLFAAGSVRGQTREEGPWWPHPIWGADDQAGASNWRTHSQAASASPMLL